MAPNFLYKEGEPLIEKETDYQGNITGGSFFFMGEMKGRTDAEIMENIMEDMTKELKSE